MEHRIYYDYEPVYRQIAAEGGLGWHYQGRDSRPGNPYRGLMDFLNSSLCPEADSATALDLGCGGGQASIILAQRGFDVVAVDYSKTAISLAVANARREHLKIDFHIGDCTHLDFLQSASFDLIVDNHLADCLIDPPHRVAFYREIRRLLASDGAFFCETAIACEHLDPAVVQLVPGTTHNADRTRNWVTRRALMDELHSAGLDILSKQERPQDPATWGCLLTTVAY